MKKYIICVIIAIFVLSSVNHSYSQFYTYPKSISYAGAYSVQSRGADVIGWNPANLGFPDNPGFSFAPSLSLQIFNNSLSPFWFNHYFFVGSYLDDVTKEKMLKFIPGSHLFISPVVQLRFFGLSFGRWAVSLGSEFIGAVTIPKPIFQFLFFGNEFENPIDISDTDFEFQSVISVAIAHGREIPIEIPYLNNLLAGIGIKLLVGSAYSSIDDVQGSITTYRNRVAIDGDLDGRYGIGGIGFAVDLGIASDINEKMSANLSLSNLFGSINWGLYESNKVEYSVHSVIYAKDYEHLDSLITEGIERDTIYSCNRFNSVYPSYLMAGFQYKFNPDFNIYFNLRKYFTNRLASSTVPCLSVGGDYRVTSWLPLRFGIAGGGRERFRWAVGSGLTFKNYLFDIGFSQTGGFFNRCKGFALSVGSEIRF